MLYNIDRKPDWKVFLNIAQDAQKAVVLMIRRVERRQALRKIPEQTGLGLHPTCTERQREGEESVGGGRERNVMLVVL